MLTTTITNGSSKTLHGNKIGTAFELAQSTHDKIRIKNKKAINITNNELKNNRKQQLLPDHERLQQQNQGTSNYCIDNCRYFLENPPVCKVLS